MSVSIGAPLRNLEGGLFTRDFEKWVKEVSGNRASVCMGALLGEPGGGLLYWGP